MVSIILDLEALIKKIYDVKNNLKNHPQQKQAILLHTVIQYIKMHI